MDTGPSRLLDGRDHFSHRLLHLHSELRNQFICLRATINVIRLSSKAREHNPSPERLKT